MNGTGRAFLVFLLAAFVCAALAVTADASPAAGRRAPAPGAVGPASYSPDHYESDNTPATANDITDDVAHAGMGVPIFGNESYEETHTLQTGGSPDVDWYKLTISDADFAMPGLSYRIEAWTDSDNGFNPVIEVYGPGDTFVPSDPLTIPFMSDYQASTTSCVAGITWSPWTDPSPQCSFTPHVTWGCGPGTYYIRVRDYTVGSGATSYQTPSDGEYHFRIKIGQMSRLAGTDRVRTAARIAQEGWKTDYGPATSVDASVVITNGWNYPDALAGSVLAGEAGGPILLTRSDHISQPVIDELKRLKYKGAYVLGRASAVSDTAKNELQAAIPGLHIKRLGGAGRIDTANMIAEETARIRAAKGHPPVTLAFLATAYDFPDALAASAMSSYNGAPILLTHGTYLDTATRDEITHLGITDVVIVGGTSVVSNTVKSAVVAALPGISPADHVLRIGGVDRYDTAVRFALWASDLEGAGVRGDGYVGTTASPTIIGALNGSRMGVASGENYPDALAGGALCGKALAPLLLTTHADPPPGLFGPPSALTGGREMFYQYSPFFTSYLFGGEAAVSMGGFQALDGHTGWIWY